MEILTTYIRMEYFVYLPEYRLLVCRSCRAAVIGCRIQAHLKNTPHKLEKTEIQQVQRWASELDIVQGKEEIPGILIPPQDSLPIKALGQPSTGGFHCTFSEDCRYMSARIKKMREHLRESHSWDQSLRAGRRSAATAEPDGPWRAGVLYQRFFVAGPRSEYFEVARGLGLDGVRAQREAAEANVQQAIDAFQSKANRIRAKEAEQIQEPDDFASPNPWLRRLGSATHLKDFSGKKDFLRGLVAMEYQIDPDDPDSTDDRQLQHIHDAFERLVSRARAVATPEAVSWNALFEVNRKELNKERSKPFHARFKAKTQTAYISVYRQLLAYIVRAVSLDNKAERPPFKLSRRQTEAYEAMMAHADDLTDAWEEYKEDRQAEPVARLLTALEDNILELCISILDHLTKDTEYNSILVSFLTVLSIRPDDTWEGYSNFTPKLSAIMAISRLLVVKYAVDQRAKLIQRKRQWGQSQEEAEESSPSHFELVSNITRRFMVGGGEGIQTIPIQFIVRLRNYGMAAHNNTATRGSVSWDKEDIVFKGSRINILNVQGMLQTALRQAESVLYKNLLFCKGFTDQSPAALGLPVIPWDELLDNAANIAIGLSLVDSLYRHDNGASKGWVFQKIWTDNARRGAWVQSITTGADMELNPKVACRYGIAVERLLELLLFLIHLSYGQPARAPEILTVRYKNTADRGVRNVLVDQGLVMIVTGYHKGFSRSERLKVIHRFVPREVGILLVYYLWLVLPFWEEVQANIWDKESFCAAIWASEESVTEGNTQAEGQGQVDDYSRGNDNDNSDNSDNSASRPGR